MVWVCVSASIRFWLLVLQFDVGAHRVDIQTDARFLEFGGLIVEALRERDTGIGGIACGQRAKNQQILIHDGVDHDFARGLFVGARLVGAFAADLVAANKREVQDGLRKRRAGFDELKRTGGCGFAAALRCFERCTG